MSSKAVAATLARASIGLSTLAQNQFEKIRDAIGDARVVLIGEETHGTQEFYDLRAEITKALIERENFSLVLCESDFPTFYALHKFVGGDKSSTESSSPSPCSSSPHKSSKHSRPEQIFADMAPNLSAEEVMEVLKTRFPVWMWRNEVIRDFVQWLQQENQHREFPHGNNCPSPSNTQQKSVLPVALFGLDIYSMFSSTDQVISYLDDVDPKMAERARQRYEALQRFRPHEKAYCYAVLRGTIQPQDNRIRKMLEDLDRKAHEYKNVFGDGDEYFSAHENARIVVAAEDYYRHSYFGGKLTWNIRDHAMVDMILNALAFHDEKLKQLGDAQQKPAKQSRAVVWAHNSHIGDAAATEQYKHFGQVNVGHLIREVLGKDKCFLLGLSTSHGTVRASRHWNGRDYVMKLKPPILDSTGDVLHNVARTDPEQNVFGVVFRSNNPQRPCTKEEIAASFAMQSQRLERFIGVQYIKQTERESHYSMCSMSMQFDMVIHLEKTSALRPLPELMEPKLLPKSSPSLGPASIDYTEWENFDEKDEYDEELE